jgi:tetratricopeptide (TPR) repeat protein
MPVLGRPDARADPELFGMALVEACHSGRFIDIATSVRLGGQALELARQLDSERLLISALGVLSSACYFSGEPEHGVPLGRESVERARTLGDDVLLAASLSGYLLCIDLFDPVSAGKLFDEAIACTQRSGDRLFAYILQNNAGVHALRVGDIPAARAHLEAAIQAAQANGENSDTVRINLGWVRRRDADYDGAWSSFEDGLRLSRRSGKRSDIAYAALGLACLAADAGEWSRAGVLHGAAQAILDQTGEPWQEPEVRYRRESLAQVRAHLGEEQSGRDYARGMALNSDQILDLVSRKDSRYPISAAGD